MTRALHEANLAMCAGQGRDIAFEAEARVTMDDYVAMIAGKTAALFGAACEIGALAAGSDLRRARAYGELGRAYGLGFQVEDDLLGTWGEAAATGKPVGSDLARRKWTFPVVSALDGPPSPAREVIAECYAKQGALVPEDVSATMAALDALGIRRRRTVARAERISIGPTPSPKRTPLTPAAECGHFLPPTYGASFE